MYSVSYIMEFRSNANDDNDDDGDNDGNDDGDDDDYSCDNDVGNDGGDDNDAGRGLALFFITCLVSFACHFRNCYQKLW